jgi:hypothetical protein
MDSIAPTGSPSAKGPSDLGDRALVDFLEADVLRWVVRARDRRLVAAVRKAIERRDPELLQALPERSRRLLLEILEQRVRSGSETPAPLSVVRLASMVSAAPPPDARWGRLLATPAR